VNEPALESVTWAISDGRAGMANQVRGLAEAMGTHLEGDLELAVSQDDDR
jgi:hypothetical protein